MAKVEVLLPQWGMGMSEGTISSWLKADGDRRRASGRGRGREGGGDAGILATGTPVEVRTPVAVIETG
jgi:hypothetical protein